MYVHSMLIVKIYMTILLTVQIACIKRVGTLFKMHACLCVSVI